MAVFAVSITKDLLWRGNRQPFSNVYHYVTEPGELFEDVMVIDKLVAAEKLIHATSVNFLTGRSWGPTENGPTASKMREVKALTGTGALTPSTNFYPELAMMIYWPLGRYGVRNHPQYLRKWIHGMRSGGLPMDGTRYVGTTPPEIQQYIDSVRLISLVSPFPSYNLSTWNGEHEAGTNGALYPYLEHRQLGR